MSTEFSELHAEDVHKIKQLKANAAEVYKSIINDRELGKDYVFAAFTYFAKHFSEQLDEIGYFLLRISYFFYTQYQAICPLAVSKAKQKEICDLLRYICKPLVDHDLKLQEKSDSKKLLQLCLDFMLQQAQLKGAIYEKRTGFIKGFSLEEKIFQATCMH